MERFNTTPAALDCVDSDGNTWVWVAPELRFSSEGPDGRYVEIPGESDVRTFGIASVELDTPTECRFTTDNGSICIARAIRPYDAVALGVSELPLPVEDISAKGLDNSPDQQRSDGSALVLDPTKVFVDVAEQRKRAQEFAEVIAYDLRGAESIPTWRKHVGATHIGWGPAKIPLRHSKVGLTNGRFVTPTIAESLWKRQLPQFRVEHVIARRRLADEWTADWATSGGSLDSLAELVWRYRWATVLMTPDEESSIGRTGATERYLAAGIFHVYDRLNRCDVPVACLDPSSNSYSED